MFYGRKNGQRDTIGHEENGYLAYRPADESPSSNSQEITRACIGTRAPSSGRILAENAETTLVQGQLES
jgi:hypothetical protein